MVDSTCPFWGGILREGWYGGKERARKKRGEGAMRLILDARYPHRFCRCEVLWDLLGGIRRAVLKVHVDLRWVSGF